MWHGDADRRVADDDVPARHVSSGVGRTRAVIVNPQAATLSVFRDTADDVQDRWVRIFIDEAAEEILRYGEELSRELPPGRHRLKAHNTLSSDTIEVDLAPGQHVRVRCHNRIARGGLLMMLTTGFAFINVKLEVLDTP